MLVVVLQLKASGHLQVVGNTAVLWAEPDDMFPLWAAVSSSFLLTKAAEISLKIVLFGQKWPSVFVSLRILLRTLQKLILCLIILDLLMMCNEDMFIFITEEATINWEKSVTEQVCDVC